MVSDKGEKMKKVEKHLVTLEFNTKEELESITENILKDNPSVRLAGILNYNITKGDQIK